MKTLAFPRSFNSKIFYSLTNLRNNCISSQDSINVEGWKLLAREIGNNNPLIMKIIFLWMYAINKSTLSYSIL